MLVLDASAALALALGDADDSLASALTERLASEQAVVPSHWALEVNNGLRTATRRGRLPAASARRAQRLLLELPIATDSASAERSWTTTFELAARSGLTVYDAAYLELAIRLDGPLATANRALAAAAGRYRVNVLT